MTMYFPSHSITIYRRRRIGSTNRYAMSATFTAHSADIQPASQERIESVQGRFGATFQAFIDPSIDIKEGDQLSVEGYTHKFGVKGVSQWEGAGLLDHKELILVSIDA